MSLPVNARDVTAQPWIMRPKRGYLALVTADKLLTYALPDVEFWAWLRDSGWRSKLVAANPRRMIRVDRTGVYPLVRESTWVDDAGFTRDDLVTKRPPEKPILITAKMEIQ